MAEAEQFEATLDSIASSLDTLESLLKPVLDRPLEETLAELPGPLERARLLFWIAYVVHSCSWIYVRLRGVDPEEHGVMDELKRIQKYNGKILAAMQANAAASDGVETSKDERSMKIDKKAASRFIKAAISNQPPQPSAESSFYSASANVTDPMEGRDGPGPHTRLSSLARASSKNADEDEDESSSEEEELQVHDGDLAAAAQESRADAGHESSTSAGKKRKLESDEQVKPKKAKKVDPLSGYDKADKPLSKTAKKKLKIAAALARGSEKASSAANSAAGSETGTPEQSDSQEKKRKRKEKRKDKKEKSAKTE